jgi:hypothetical protein
MFFRVDEAARSGAKSPHELAMVNLLLFNLLLLIALLAGSFLQSGSVLAHYKIIGILVPLAISLSIVAYTFLQAGRVPVTEPWFVAAHWRLAADRYKILLGAYLAGAALIGLGGLIAHSYRDPRMQELMFIALQRVAIAPILISLMVLIMLESGSIYQAGRGEVPNRLAERLPPPVDLARSESPFGEVDPEV